ncbi:N-acetyltransferase family protein [Chitinophaga sancti]|uniref:GNAT family N-acetyltransferase n=1 Tax=Chitinophaga sancti TaxID=1004 RepID=UPI003F79D59A
MQAFSIRLAGEKDFPAIFLLIREFASFQQSSDKVSITPAQMAADKDLFQAFVAESNGVIVGFATFFWSYYSWSGKALYLDDLYLQPGYRKQGIGKALLQAVIELARSRNCKKVRWQVSNWNRNAIEFYQKMGAVVDDVEINCDLVLH